MFNEVLARVETMSLCFGAFYYCQVVYIHFMLLDSQYTVSPYYIVVIVYEIKVVYVFIVCLSLCILHTGLVWSAQ